MDQDFIDALVLYALEDKTQTATILADLKEWRNSAFAQIRAGNGSSIFEITSTSQHGKSVSGQMTMTNLQLFAALTIAIGDITEGSSYPSLTFADFSRNYER
jgi:hypothetical protein